MHDEVRTMLAQAGVNPGGIEGTGVVAWLALVGALASLALGVALLLRHRRLKRRYVELHQRFTRVETDLLRARRRLYAAHADAAPARIGGHGSAVMEFTAEWGEDLFLWDLFESRRTGTYLEVGAFDGHTLSVTYPFERAGWTGVLIEPLPDRFRACQQCRPGSFVVHAALSRRGSSGSVEFASVPGNETSAMLSYLSTNEPHKKLVERREREPQRVKVPLTTMDDVLDRAQRERGIGRLDFAVVDVEGGELDLLDGFDLDRHRPRVLIIEDLYKGTDTRVVDHMRARSYELCGRIGRNQVFVRGDEHELARRARELASVLA